MAESVCMPHCVWNCICRSSSSTIPTHIPNVRAELARSHTEHSLRTQSISSIDIHHTKMYVLLFVRFSLVWDRFAIAFLFIPYVLYVYIRAIYFFLIQWERGSESYMPSECEWARSEMIEYLSTVCVRAYKPNTECVRKVCAGANEMAQTTIAFT